MDTIYALASAEGRAGVAVIRVSGPEAPAVARYLAGREPPERRASLARLRDVDGDTLDHALVLSFRAGASFTGEPVVEFHTHGSQAVVAAVLRRIGTLPGVRLAEPGEFTRRALTAGRLDLTEVEGLADLISAETEAQRKLAQRLFSGELGHRAAAWRADLTRALALLAVTIDFADEDVPDDMSAEVGDLVARTRSAIVDELAGAERAERVRDGFEVAILGAPNVGKSTLLNALAGREAALTSEIAGTTRDVIEVRLDLRGLPVTMLDTAGIRETADHVEGLGVDRARARARAADLRVVLSQGEVPPGVVLLPDDIVIGAKADVTGTGVSGLTGQGVSDLLDRIAEVLTNRASGASLAVHARHRAVLERSALALDEAERSLSYGPAFVDRAADDLRAAVAGLDALVGRIDVEDVLDAVFQGFCLGK